MQNPQLLIANLARLQAILIAGRTPQGPVGLLKSVGQHRELAAVAQRAGGTARTSAVKTVAHGKFPFLQETGQGLVTAAVQGYYSHAGLGKGWDKIREKYFPQMPVMARTQSNSSFIREDFSGERG